MYPTIVAAIDETTDPGVTRMAGQLAKELGSTLVFAHVADDPPLRGSHADRERSRHAALRRARENLHWSPDELPDEVEVRQRVVLGSPAQELIAIARDEQAELLVVGSRGRGPLTSALMGSVSRTLAREAPCSVLILTPEAVQAREAASENGHLDGDPASSVDGSPPDGAAPSSVVAGVDGSERSRDAALVAAALASRLDARLVVVHALDAGTGMVTATEVEAADMARDMLTSIEADGEVRVEWGPASHVLESVAAEEGARAIVIGARDIGALRAAALGSVTAELLRHSRHALLVVPERAWAAARSPHEQAERAA